MPNHNHCKNVLSWKDPFGSSVDNDVTNNPCRIITCDDDTMAGSVQWLATSWTTVIQFSPVAVTFPFHVQARSVAHPASYPMSIRGLWPFFGLLRSDVFSTFRRNVLPPSSGGLNLQDSPEQYSVTPKMEAVLHSSEMSFNTSTSWRGNLKEGHQLIDNRRESLSTWYPGLFLRV
jgi:hypothetical protein